MPAQTNYADAVTSVAAAGDEVEKSCRPVRLGLLVDEPFLPRWAAELMQKLQDDGAVELAILIWIPGSNVRRWPHTSWLFRLWAKLDEWIFKEQADPLDWDSKTYTVETVTRFLDAMGKRQASPADVEQIKSHHFDVLVRLGSHDLPDELSACAKHGIWTFHYEGYTPAESELALFGNLYDGRSSSVFVLGGNNGDQWILDRCVFSNDLISWCRNLVLDCQQRSQILRRCISELSQGKFPGMANPNSNDIARERKWEPSVSNVMFRFIARWIGRAARRLWVRIAFREQWFIAYGKDKLPTQNPTSTKTTALGRFRLMKPFGPGNYADPFLFARNGKTYIFFEEYRAGHAGVICCAEFQANGSLGETQRVLSRNYHLSYPFVFECRQQVYMLPETQENRTIEVYRSIDFPHQWELAAVLMSDVSAVDPTIFQYKNKLWLFAAGFGGEGTESNELSLFWADTLFGQWHSHPKNPVVRDVTRARPAGSLFFRQGSLIRPAQNCAGSYGNAISLNRVDHISETDYKEVPVETILPDWMSGIFATHTLNQFGGVTVMDARAKLPRLPFLRNTIARAS